MRLLFAVIGFREWRRCNKCRQYRRRRDGACVRTLSPPLIKIVLLYYKCRFSASGQCRTVGCFFLLFFPVLLIIVNKDEYNRQGCHCCLCQCGIVSTVIFPVSEHHRPLASTKLDCLIKAVITTTIRLRFDGRSTSNCSRTTG